MATPTYNINYDDEQFKQVEAEKQSALDNVNNTYNSMINQSDKYYQDQIDAIKDYANTQSQIQQQQSDLVVNQLQQQKDQAGKDYTKEQKGAYADWQKQSNQYGANAEQMASQGLTNTGYSESSQTSMYNQYQGRVATARETYNQAVMNYDNKMAEARLTNNATLAEIAFNSLQAELELSLEGFQYKNSLLSEQIAQQQATEDRYYSRWQDVLNQFNQENQFAESIRQYKQNYKFQVEQFAEEKKQFEKNYAQQIKEFEEGIRQFDEQMEYYRKKDAEENAYKIKQLELEKQQLQQQQAQWEKEYQLQLKAFEEEQRQFNKTYSASTSSTKLTNGSNGGSQLTNGGSGTDNFGNNASTQQKSDYYFSNGYQPQYINNAKVEKSGLKVWNVFAEGTSNKTATKFGKQNIWKANGKYYVWDGSIKDYVDVTDKVNKSIKNSVNYEWGS